MKELREKQQQGALAPAEGAGADGLASAAAAAAGSFAWTCCNPCCDSAKRAARREAAPAAAAAAMVAPVAGPAAAAEEAAAAATREASAKAAEPAADDVAAVASDQRQQQFPAGAGTPAGLEEQQPDGSQPVTADAANGKRQRKLSARLQESRDTAAALDEALQQEEAAAAEGTIEEEEGPAAAVLRCPLEPQSHSVHGCQLWCQAGAEALALRLLLPEDLAAAGGDVLAKLWQVAAVSSWHLAAQHSGACVHVCGCVFVRVRVVWGVGGHVSV